MARIELLHSDKKTLKLEGHHVELSERNIKIDSLKNNLYLIEFSHKSINTLLDLTGSNNYQILAFDGNDQFIGASLALENDNGFMIQTQARKVIILPYSELIIDAQKTIKLVSPMSNKS